MPSSSEALTPAPAPTAAVGEVGGGPAADVPTREIAVVLPAHLHARPAGRLAQASARFTSAVRLEYGDRTVDPASVLSVMGLGATAGTTVTVRAEGEDADAAAAALAEILANAE